MHEHLADLSLQVYLPSLGVDPERRSCLCGQLLRQDARGGGKCLRLCMTRKRIAVAAEDYQIMCFSARPTICLLTQFEFKCAPAACSGLLHSPPLSTCLVAGL